MIKQPIVFPPSKQWNQPNTGFLQGSLYQTQNVSLDVPGVISLSRRAAYVGRQDDSGSPTFKYVLSIVYDGQAVTGAEKYYMVTNGSVWRMNFAFTSFEVDPTASPPTLALASTDGIIWTDGLYVSISNNVSKLSAGAWTAGQMAFTNAGVPHPLCASASANYLLGGDGNLVQKKDPSTGTVTVALTLPANYRVQWIRSSYARTLIGCRNMNGGDSAVFEWDEVSPTWTNKYDIDANLPYSGEFRNTDFFIILNDGRLQKFNGGGFSTVAQLPIYKTLPPSYWAGASTPGSVLQRGMQTIGGRLTILISGNVDNNDSKLYPNQLSGIWEYDELTGLNHKYSPSYSQSSEDFGQALFVEGAGAIAEVVVDPVTSGPASTLGSVILFGARVYGSSANYYTLGSVVTTGTGRGSFVTTRAETSDIADDSKKLWVKYRGLFTADDKIIFKVKEEIRNGIPFCATRGVTFTSTTTFTTDSSDVALWANAQVGDEVFVCNKVSAGAAANISAITGPATNVYTVTLDEAIPNKSSGTAVVIVDNFRRLDTTVTYSDETQYKGIPLQQTDPSDWVQVKVEMRGSYTVTLEEMQLVPSSHVLPTP